jgi:hypothetical protein
MSKTISINIPERICYLRKQMNIALTNNNTDLYYNLLDEVMKLMQERTELLSNKASKQNTELKLMLKQYRYDSCLSIIK